MPLTLTLCTLGIMSIYILVPKPTPLHVNKSFMAQGGDAEVAVDRFKEYGRTAAGGQFHLLCEVGAGCGLFA